MGRQIVGRRAARGVVSAAVGAAVIAGFAPGAVAATISDGHVDLLDVDVVAGVPTLDVKTYSPANDDVAASSVQVAIPATSTTTLPTGDAWACLGKGAKRYISPQSQTAGVPWLGTNTQDVASGAGPIQLDLTAWTGPTGSQFAVYQTSLGAPSVKLNTNTATGCSVPRYAGGLAAGSHAHATWAFSHTGTYTLTFRATTASGAATDPVTYSITVG